MNERIRQLAEQADIQFYKSYVPETGFKYEGAEVTVEDLKKFAELIVRECAHLVGGYVKENEFGPATDVKEAYEEITKHFGVK